MIFIRILLLIDGVIYGLIDGVYDIFDFLARVNIFSEDSYNDIVGRIYIVLGVIMLFVLAYTLLRAIINPDDFAKGEKSFPSLAKNIVVSLILIVLLPTIFNIAFSMQNALLNTGTITKLILGDTNMEYTEKYADGETITMDPGRMMAINTFSAFFYPSQDYCENEVSIDISTREGIEQCKDSIRSDGFIFRGDATLREIDRDVKNGSAMTYYSRFSTAVDEDQIEYTMIISTVCGIFLLYVLLNFCFDMALRVVKLMFYQIIAPIPVVCRIIPFGKLKEVFGNWLKQVTSTFVELFIRIAIMNFGVLLIKLVCESFNNGYRNGILTLGRSEFNLSWLQFSLARVLIIMGIVMFIRKAPELLSKMFGIDTSGMSLGLMNRLRDGGALTAGAALGAGGGMLLRNGANAIRNTISEARTNGGLAAVRTGIRGLGSTIAGTTSGLVRGGYRGRNAQNAQDMRNARNGAIDTATQNRVRRENYRATHGGTALGAVGGHAVDTFDNVSNWILENGPDQYADELRIYEQLNRYRGSIESTADEIRERSGDNNGLASMVFVQERNKYLKEHSREFSEEAAREFYRDNVDFQNASVDDQRTMIQNYMASERQRVERDAQSITNRRYGSAQNLDEIRRRVQRLQNTTFTVGMEVDGQRFDDAQSWDNYVATATHALNDFERTSSEIIRRTIVNNDTISLQTLGWSDQDGNITASGGVRDRIENIQGNTQSINQTFEENRNIIEGHLNNVMNQSTIYERMDESGHAISRRQAEINVEREQRERRNAARGNNNNNGH